MKRIFYAALAVSAILTAVFAGLVLAFGGELWVALLTTAATMLYHFAMRLAVGFFVERVFPKTVNFDNAWFRAHRWERPLYRFLRVRKWARRVPTFRPEQFDVKALGLPAIARQTCLSEVVHEVIIAAGYLSLLFCFFFDDPAANIAPFLITAVIAGAYDLQFVILQRFHRPAVLRVMRRR